MLKTHFVDEALTSFTKGTVNHKMTILKEDGVYRHLRFKTPDTFNLYFDIITFPGNLMITGDMGTWSFSRIEDMFKFFRSKERDISPDYWAEKLTSVDRNSYINTIKFGHEEFSEKKLRENVNDWISEETTGHPIPIGLEEELNDLIAAHIDDGEYAVMRAILDFEFRYHNEYGEIKFINFTDFYEVNNRVYSFDYLWVCHAIVWAIEQYDKSKTESL